MYLFAYQTIFEKQKKTIMEVVQYHTLNLIQEIKHWQTINSQFIFLIVHIIIISILHLIFYHQLYLLLISLLFLYLFLFLILLLTILNVTFIFRDFKVKKLIVLFMLMIRTSITVIYYYICLYIRCNLNFLILTIYYIM